TSITRSPFRETSGRKSSMSANLRNHRKPTRALLALECLEDRRVLSGGALLELAEAPRAHEFAGAHGAEAASNWGHDHAPGWLATHSPADAGEGNDSPGNQSGDGNGPAQAGSDLTPAGPVQREVAEKPAVLVESVVKIEASAGLEAVIKV